MNFNDSATRKGKGEGLGETDGERGRKREKERKRKGERQAGTIPHEWRSVVISPDALPRFVSIASGTSAFSLRGARPPAVASRTGSARGALPRRCGPSAPRRAAVP